MNAANLLFNEKIYYLLLDREGQSLEEGETQIGLEGENLTLLHASGDGFHVELRDIADISADDHKISVLLHSGQEMILSRLGYRYKDAHRELILARNEVILKDLLMGETLQAGGIKAQADFPDKEKRVQIQSPCEIRLYETALVFLPQNAEVTRIPYSFIQSVEEANYTLMLVLVSGEQVTFSKAGPHFDHLKASLSAAMNKMLLSAQETLRELMPFLPSMEIRDASRLLKEGRAVEKKELVNVSPGLWEELEKNIAVFGMEEYYAYLKGLSSDPDYVYAGLKKGLMGGQAGLYLWFMLPIYHNDPRKPGNAVVLEASGSDGSGRATYFFRIFPRGEYRSGLKPETLKKSSANCSEFINRAMLTINFRREPVYISQEQLKEPRFKQYQFSIKRLPELRELRSRFIGRVMHHSLAQWQQDTLSLLTFNVDCTDDCLRWEKGFEVEESE